MPLYKRKPFEPVQPDKHQVLKDNQEVFYCELSKEIFDNYEEYFERTMLFNSTIWTCALSGRSNLTYAEALESEKKYRKMIAAFPQVLKGPVIFIANLTKRSSISDLVDDVFNYVNVRYFKTEKVLAKDQSSDNFIDCEIVGFMNGTGESSPNAQISPEDIKYRVRRLEANGKSPILWTVTAEQIRRKKVDNSLPFSKDKLKLFLKQCIEYNDVRILTIKPDAYKKYVADENITNIQNFFTGKVPVFTLSKTQSDKNDKDKKKANDQKKKVKEKKLENGEAKKKQANGKEKKTKERKPGKQTSLDAFVTKDGEKIADLKKIKKLEEEDARRQKELKVEQQRILTEERKKQAAEMLQLVQTTVRNLNAVKDDLEIQDQKPLPLTKIVKTLIPEKYFADAIMIQEFIYSFTNILEDKDKFRSGIDLCLMERALLTREVAGPLSDILQVLLGSIFAFQIEESNETAIEFEDKTKITFKDNVSNERQDFIRRATTAAKWPKRYLSMNMYDLPIDATTLTELLRLHFLTSGARLNDVGNKYRFQIRGGFQGTDDAGVTLCLENPHIIRALSCKTVYELPLEDVMSILKCLVAQVMSYSTFRETFDERLEKMNKARASLRNLQTADRKRETTLAAEKKEVLEELRKTIEALEGTDAEKSPQIDSLTRKAEIKINQLDATADREKKKFENQVASLKRDIFDYQLYLGSDRAYRNYWLFESLPGLFIEHQPVGSPCLKEPVKNIPGLSSCPPEKRYLFIKQMLQGKHNNNDKENISGNIAEAKTSEETFEVATDTKLTQEDLLMCTGDTETCSIHGKKRLSHSTWAFLNTEEEISALIDSLNTRGVREKNLKEQLESQKELILSHLKECPLDLLQIEPSEYQTKLEQIISNTKNRAYINANFNYPKDVKISEIMLTQIRNLILEIELELFSGQLGEVNVKDRISWRKAIENNNYQMQVPYLEWGPYNQFHEDANGLVNSIQQNVKPLQNGNDGASENMDEDDDEDKSSKDSVEDKELEEEEEENEEQIKEKPKRISKPIKYEDPGIAFGSDIENKEDGTSESSEYQKRIHDLACALLQIAQSIDPKYFKPPFGVLKPTSKKDASSFHADRAKKHFNMWCVSLMNCKNASQLFLHFNVLHDTVRWARSVQNAKCVCRSSRDPDKLLLCDGCNIGRHIYCLKPKLTKVPEGDWFCNKCEPNQEQSQKKQRKTIVYTESDEESEEEESEEEDGDEEENDEYNSDQSANDSQFSDQQSQDVSDLERKTCVRCNKGSRNLFKCSKCPRYYDTKCLNMRSKPGPKWMCTTCTTNSNKNNRKRDRTVDDSDSDYESLAKSSRNGDERRSSRRRTDNSPPAGQRLSSTRRSRNALANDDGLLDLVVIQKLLDEAVKQNSSWPFLRPVNKSDAPDYFKLIKTPMDLSKIRSNLNQGKYSNNYEVMKHIQLIYDNCATYNQDSSDVYVAGVELEEFFINRCRELNLPYTPSIMHKNYEEPVTKRKKA